MGWVQVEATLSGGMHPQTTPQHKCVMYTEHSFELHSGVAQGCPLSSVLFLCITEALTRLVQHDPNILGVETNGVRHKISQFADDTTLIAKPPDLPHRCKNTSTHGAKPRA